MVRKSRCSVDGVLDPGWNRDRSDMSSFAYQVCDKPASSLSWELLESQSDDLRSSETAAHEQCNDRVIAKSS